MHKELLSQTTLTVLPLAAMLIFLAVFVAVVVRELRKKREEIDACARLPLQKDSQETGHGN